MRRMVAATSLALLIFPACGNDAVVSDDPWELNSSSAKNPTKPPDKPASFTGCSTPLSGEEVFSQEGDTWIRKLPHHETDDALYQATIILKNVSDQEWTAEIHQSLCIKDKNGGVVWTSLSPRVNYPENESQTSLEWVFRAPLELVDQRKKSYAVDCMRGIGIASNSVIAPWPKISVKLEGGIWYKLPEVDKTTLLQPKHNLSQWSDSYYEPIPEVIRYFDERLDYAQRFGARLYWPIIHKPGEQPADDKIAQRLALCSAIGLPPNFGKPPTDIAKAFHVQNITSLALPSEAHGYLYEIKYKNH